MKTITGVTVYNATDKLVKAWGVNSILRMLTHELRVEVPVRGKDSQFTIGVIKSFRESAEGGIVCTIVRNDDGDRIEAVTSTVKSDAGNNFNSLGIDAGKFFTVIK